MCKMCTKLDHIISAQSISSIISAQSISATKNIVTKISGTENIGNREYREQRISGTENIGKREYWAPMLCAHCFVPNALRQNLFLLLVLLWAGPRPHIPFPPDLIFVCKFSHHGSSSPVTSHLAPSIMMVFPDSADAYSRTTASYRLTQLCRPNTRE